MKVLLSAYACEPGRGSEPEVGFQAMLVAAERHDVWVLTRTNNLPSLHHALVGHPASKRICLEGLDLGPLAIRVKRRGLFGLHWYYDRWQRAAGERARRLDARIDFDLVHHVTFASHWTRAGVAEVPKPFLWGPVGGGVEGVSRLSPILGVHGVIEELGRLILRRVSEVRPSVRMLPGRARLTLVQNEETRRRLGRGKAVEVLSNATAAMVDTARAKLEQDASVAFVARLTPWKGAVLAILAFRHVQHPNAVLRIYGDGPDRPRAERAARAWGLERRVLFMGKVPREQVHIALARSGVLLHPAIHEEAGFSVAEALSLGTPVVALDRGGPRELVRQWPDSPAALVGPGTPNRVARRLAEAVDGFLDRRPSVRPHPEVAPVSPRRTFREGLLAAYERAASGP